MSKKERGLDGLSGAMDRFLENNSLRNKRLHLSNRPLSLEAFQDGAKQQIEYKPNGLWYGFGDSWIKWCQSEMEHWLCPMIYEIKLRRIRVRRISDIAQFEAFEEEYKTHSKWEEQHKLMLSMAAPSLSSLSPKLDSLFFGRHINYPLLAESYGALEIVPYLWPKRLTAMWYYGWDCASGCVWEKEAIKSIDLFAHFDEKTQEFVID